MTAEPFHRFLQKSVQLPPFPIVRPFDWQKLFLVVSSIVTFATLTKLAWPTLQKILQNKNVWAAGSLVSPTPIRFQLIPRLSSYFLRLGTCIIPFDILRIPNQTVAADSIISQGASKINLELRHRLLHSSV